MDITPLKEFQGGNDNQRDHLNEIVRRINELTQEVKNILNWNEEVVCVHNTENTNITRVSIKGLTIIEDVGVIECDCVSGQLFGDF